MLDLHSSIYYSYFKNKAMESVHWLTDPIPLGEFDLHSIMDLNLPQFERVFNPPSHLQGSQINIMTVYPDVTLSPGIELKRSLEVTDRTNSWLYPVWLHRQPLALDPGNTLRIHYAPIQTATMEVG